MLYIRFLLLYIIFQLVVLPKFMFIHVKPNTAQSSYIVILYTKRIKIASLAQRYIIMVCCGMLVLGSILALIESDGFDVDFDKRYIFDIFCDLSLHAHMPYCTWRGYAVVAIAIASSTWCGKYNKHILNRFDTISKLLIFIVRLCAIAAIVFRLVVYVLLN